MDGGFTITVNQNGWNDIMARLQEFGVRFAGREVRKGVSKSLDPMVQSAKQEAPKDTGSLRESIVPKVKVLNRIRRGGYGYIWGAAGVKTNSLYVSASGKVRRPPHYYYIIEKGRVSNEKRAANPIANRLNPNRKAYLNRGDSNRANPFLRRAFERGGNQSLQILRQELEKSVEKVAMEVKKK